MAAARALIFETSTPVGSITLVDAEGALDIREFGSDRRHNSALFAPLEEILAGVEKLDLVLVGSGPGSYSGTRVGIAAAQGVAIAMGCPAVAVPSVLAVEPVAEGRPCLVVGDARRGTYWSIRIEKGEMGEPLLEEAEAWQTTMAAARTEGLETISFEEPSGWGLVDGSDVSVVTPKASLLWHAWQSASPASRERWQSQIPQPMYLKPPHITKAKRGVLG